MLFAGCLTFDVVRLLFSCVRYVVLVVRCLIGVLFLVCCCVVFVVVCGLWLFVTRCASLVVRC